MSDAGRESSASPRVAGDREHLTPVELAEACGSSVAVINRLIELDLLTSDLCRRDINGVRLMLSFEDAGIDLEAFASAVREGALSLAFTRQLLADPIELAPKTFAAALGEVQLQEAFVEAMFSAMGLPKPEANRLMRRDELSLLHLIAAADRQGLDHAALVRVLRAFSQNGKRIAEAMRDLFRSEVEGPMLASGASLAEMMSATAPRRVALQNIGFTTVRLLLSRYTEDVVFDNVATRIEAALAERGDAQPRDNTRMAVTFVDLEGFTLLTRQAGDEVAGDVIVRFEDAAHEVLAAHGGRLVKSLGDGLLSTFADPADAVPASLALLRRLEAASLPRARVGLSVGPVLRRDGDVFGNTVNLAARLVSVAGPGEIVADSRTTILFRDLTWEAEYQVALEGLGNVTVRKHAGRRV